MRNKTMKKLRKNHIYYKVCFDGLDALGRKLPKEITDKFETDISFELNEFDDCMVYVNGLRDVKADYGFYFEVWDEEEENVEHPVNFRNFYY